MTGQEKIDFVKSLALPKYSYNNAVIGFIKDCIISCWTIMPTSYPLHKPEFKTPNEIIGIVMLQIVRTEFAHKYMLEHTAYKIALDLITRSTPFLWRI